MRYRHIVFDIDGTLIDTEYSVLHSLQETLLALPKEELCPDAAKRLLSADGKSIPLENLTFVLGITGTDALRQIGIKNIPAALSLWLKNAEKYADSTSVFPGIKELLEKLLEAKYELGIISSRTRKEFEADLQPSGLLPYFTTVVLSDDTAEHKPDPAPLLKYMELSKTDAARILYIGDSEYDSRCAKGAGVDFALAGWGSKNRSIPAEYHLKTPNEFFSAVVSKV